MPEFENLEGTIWKHLKTGHIYVVLGECMLEKEWEPGIIYRRINQPEAKSIVRAKDEFLDGRFINIKITGFKNETIT